MRFLLLLVIAALPFTLRADPPPPLTKDDARRILEAMEWREVKVIAVVEGVNEQKISAPTLAFVLALAKRDGAFRDLRLNLYYDRDIGWFSYESTPQQFRVWTRDGYREIKAGLGW